MFTKILRGSTAGGPPPLISAAVVVPSRRRRRRLLPARSRRRPLRITNKPPSSVFIFITGARPPINKYFDILYIIILYYITLCVHAILICNLLYPRLLYVVVVGVVRGRFALVFFFFLFVVRVAPDNWLFLGRLRRVRHNNILMRAHAIPTVIFLCPSATMFVILSYLAVIVMTTLFRTHTRIKQCARAGAPTAVKPSACAG